MVRPQHPGVLLLQDFEAMLPWESELVRLQGFYWMLPGCEPRPYWDSAAMLPWDFEAKHPRDSGDSESSENSAGSEDFVGSEAMRSEMIFETNHLLDCEVNQPENSEPMPVRDFEERRLKDSEMVQPWVKHEQNCEATLLWNSELWTWLWLWFLGLRFALASGGGLLLPTRLGDGGRRCRCSTRTCPSPAAPRGKACSRSPPGAGALPRRLSCTRRSVPCHRAASRKCSRRTRPPRGRCGRS